MPQQRQFDVQKAISEGAESAAIEAFMLQNNLVPLNPAAPMETEVVNQPQAPENINIGSATTIGPQSPYQKIRDYQPYISGAIGAATGIGASLSGFGTPAAGLANSAGTAISDSILNKFLYKQPQETFPISEALQIINEDETPSQNPYANAGLSVMENTLVGEVLGRIIPASKVANASKNVIREADSSPMVKGAVAVSIANKLQSVTAQIRDSFLKHTGLNIGPTGRGSVAGPLTSLDPTYSQLKQFESGGKKGKYSEWIENLFTPGFKKAAIDNSARKAIKETEDFEMLMSGSKIPASLSGEIGKSSLDDYAHRLRVRTAVNYQNLDDSLIDVRQKLEVIDSNKMLLKAATPGSPQEAALQKQVTASIKLEAKLRSQLKDLLHAKTDYFPDDSALKMELMMLNKPNMNIPFGQKVEKGLGTKDFLENPITGKMDSARPIADEIMYNIEKLKRFFHTGEAKFSNGKSIASASPRRDMKGYAYQKLLQDSYDAPNNTLNINKLKNDWNDFKVTKEGKEIFSLDNRNAIDAQIERFKYVVVPNKDIGASRYLTLRLGTGLATIGGGLTTALMGGALVGTGTAGTIVGVSFGLHQFGKLLTNKNTAALMMAISTGGPLNMSHAMASRLIGRALRGQNVEAELKDEAGNAFNVPGKMDMDGKFVASNITDLPEDTYSVKY